MRVNVLLSRIGAEKHSYSLAVLVASKYLRPGLRRVRRAHHEAGINSIYSMGFGAHGAPYE